MKRNLPGRAIANFTAIKDRAFSITHRNVPHQRFPPEWWQAESLDNILKKINATTEYYVIHNHPVHRFKDWCILIDGEGLKNFLAQRVTPEEGAGLDMTITTTAFDWLVILNHDADIWHVDVERTASLSHPKC